MRSAQYTDLSLQGQLRCNNAERIFLSSSREASFKSVFPVARLHARVKILHATFLNQQAWMITCSFFAPDGKVTQKIILSVKPFLLKCRHCKERIALK